MKISVSNAENVLENVLLGAYKECQQPAYYR